MYKIATITKAHGTRGEVVVTPKFDFGIEEDQIYYLKNNRGDYYPVRFEQFRTIRKGDNVSFFVLLTGINDRNAAEQLKGSDLFCETNPQEFFQDDEPDVFETTGFEVTDSNGKSIGNVTEILENPAHPILVISRLSDNHSFMVPFVDAYIDDVDFENEIIFVSDIQEFMTL